MFMLKIVEAHPLDGFRVSLKFADGTSGKVDLTHLAGKGVFESWNNYENFKNFSVENGRRLVWPDEIEIDADSLYLKLTGKSPDDIFPALKEEPVHA